MSEQQIYHTYKHGNKIKQIVTLAGLKKYCSTNTDNVLSFSEMLLLKGFIFRHTLKAEPISHLCRLCHKELKIYNIEENTKTVFISLCSCAVESPYSVNKIRFKTVFTDTEVETIYAKYCENKMRKWTTKGIPVASLKFKQEKFGVEEGLLRYNAICKTFDTTSVNYFMRKGYTEKEAVGLTRERQATFSLKKCIEKYGEEDGTKRFKERQDKWQNSLNNKPEEEIERINQAKIFKAGVSSIAKNFCELLYEEGDRYIGAKNGEKMITLTDSGKSRRAMVDFCRGNKVIEFFGDFWHANPKIYSDETIINYSVANKRLAKSVRTDDEIRISLIEKEGYEVLVVWETDFKNNPEKVIAECKIFLQN